MPYKITYRYTNRPSHMSVFDSTDTNTVADQLQDIFEEAVSAGDIIDQRRTVVSESEKQDVIIWRDQATREEYANRMIAVIGGNPFEDTSLWSKVTSHTVEIISEETITDDEV